MTIHTSIWITCKVLVWLRSVVIWSVVRVRVPEDATTSRLVLSYLNSNSLECMPYISEENASSVAEMLEAMPYVALDSHMPNTNAAFIVVVQERL